jgi:predicted anti-sigma-YlaC factor YlaD
MDCKKAQQLFDDLSHERLAPDAAAQVRRHLADCTDCRLVEQRSARLQRLLALKRYERPAPEYFDNFLSEFHSRISAEAQRTGWWEQVLERVDDLLAIGSVRIWRYGLAGAMGVAVVMSMMWTSVRQTSDLTGTTDHTASVTPSLVMAETMLPPPRSTPATIATSLSSFAHAASSDYQPTMAGGVVLDSTPTHADSSAPRYVLDHISVTPASYDVASVHF